MDNTDSTEAPSEDVRVTLTGIMNVLCKEEDDSLEEALQRELEEEMTDERRAAFFDDANISVEPVE